MGRRTYRWWASAVVAAVAGFVRNCRKEERFLSGEQVGGSMPGVPVVTTAQRSGRSRRTGANAMSPVFHLHISVCRCVRLRARDAAQFMLFATEQELPGVFPPVFPIQPLAEQGPYCPPFQIQQACLSLLTKAPLFDASLSTWDAWPQQAGLADGVVTHLEVHSRQYRHRDDRMILKK